MGGVFGIAGRESVRVSEKGGGEKESRQKGSRASVLFMPDALAHSPGCRWSLCTCHPPRAGLTWFSFFGLFGLVWFGLFGSFFFSFAFLVVGLVLSSDCVLLVGVVANYRQ